MFVQFWSVAGDIHKLRRVPTGILYVLVSAGFEIAD